MVMVTVRVSATLLGFPVPASYRSGNFSGHGTVVGLETPVGRHTVSFPPVLVAINRQLHRGVSG